MIAAAAALAAMVVVTQDQSALRAAPTTNAPVQALLAPGELLEVRGQRLDQLQVYDHHRERAGYIRATNVRALDLQENEAPQLLAVLRYLRDTPGSESLGIAYVAAYLKAAPAAAITAEPFDALGVLAERLARRAGRGQGTQGGAALAAQLDVAAQYGVQFASDEAGGVVQLCYDGEAFRQVLARPASAEQQARAVLALTRHDCVDRALPAQQRPALDRWRAGLLDRITAPAMAQLSGPQQNRLRLRRAGVWAAVAFWRARAGEDGSGAAQRASDELAAVNKAELPDDDSSAYNDAALRVGASRWAAAPPPPAGQRLAVQTQAGEPGQTCVLLTDAQHPANAPLARRCSYGTVWTASARAAPDGRTLALAVQPLVGWTELWVFRAAPPDSARGWDVTVLPPATTEPGLGYAEWAGWLPGAQQMLLVREARVDGRYSRSFETIALDTMATDKQAANPQWLTPFARWQDPLWKQQTLSLR